VDSDNLSELVDLEGCLENQRTNLLSDDDLNVHIVMCMTHKPHKMAGQTIVCICESNNLVGLGLKEFQTNSGGGHGGSGGLRRMLAVMSVVGKRRRLSKGATLTVGAKLGATLEVRKRGTAGALVAQRRGATLAVLVWFGLVNLLPV